MPPRVLFTSDYELFLGENLLPERQVLVDPADTLLRASEALSIPMTLFADVACLWRYRELGDDAFVDAAEGQLRDAVRRGHDVQAHVHPHWLHATRDGNRWDAPLDSFLVARLDDPAPLLRRAKAYLETLLAPAAPGYACIAFRAGNYGIQPGHDRVFAALRTAGFLVDSSVVPGLVLRNEVNRVDFRDFPPHDRIVAGIYEVPIASARLGPFAAAGRRLRRKPQGPPRGRTVQDNAGVRRTLRSRLFSLAMLELGPDVRTMRLITERFVRRAGEDVTFAVSSHPKTTGQRELDTLNAYHEWLTGAFGAQVVRVRDVVPARAAAA